MSLWTPGGEHEVPREPAGSGGAAPDGQLPDGRSLEDLSPEERARAEEMVGEMAEAQRQLVEAPVRGRRREPPHRLLQAAALHLQQDPPNLREAQLAIDALAAVLNELSGRLGEADEPLRNALNQIQAAFVEVKGRTEQG
ncbi:MAG: hypothetical protein U5R31_10550 [Acidimicrobiia bacterium]|nr:hypothetical protein [Acidimicrobiia bacterium]